MRKISTKTAVFILSSLLTMLLFAFSAFAATAGSGYTVDKNKKPTNIKWTMTAEGVLSFEIDASSQNAASTVISNIDPVTLEAAAWNKTPATYSEAVKIIIGDGIGAMEGSFQGCRQVKEIEIPTSLVSLKGAFLSCTALESIYVRGNEPVKGLFDLSHVTSIGSYSIGSQSALRQIKLNPSLKGDLPFEAIKNVGLEEIEIPEGVGVLKNSSLAKTNSLKTVTVLGMNTTFESDDVFKDNTSYPAIKAKAGSKAEQFAKANGYTFIDLDTGAETKGTKATTTTSSGTSSGTSSSSSTTSGTFEKFDPTGATGHGYISYEYNGTKVADTYWAYYSETKTLKLVSNNKYYNETGRAEFSDDKMAWTKYKDEIEHIEIGDYITKITANAFPNFPALKDVKLGTHVSQIDQQAFLNCSNLTTVWRTDGERTEGKADLSKIRYVKAGSWEGTAIEEILFSGDIALIDTVMPASLKRIYAVANNDLIAFAKENYIDLHDLNDPSKVYQYYIEIDLSLPLCGERAVFRFDEATGTVYIEGAGAIDDIINYYGGGSKNQPWFSIKKQIKHVVIGDNITEIGKYAFCQCENLETVEIPNAESFKIYNAAFEKCTNLKSIYRRGTEPIEGTADLSNVPELLPYAFAYDYLIANVIISSEVTSVGSTTFEENVNLQNIYGTPGSYAETFAAESGLVFYDVSASAPEPIKCTIPETTAAESETEAPETTDALTESITSDPTETKLALNIIPRAELDNYKSGNASSAGSNGTIIIGIAAASAAILAIVIIIVLKKTKKGKN